MYNWHDGSKNNLRTIEAQIVQKLQNDEAWPKFTGSYKKKRVIDYTLRFYPDYLRYATIAYKCTAEMYVIVACHRTYDLKYPTLLSWEIRSVSLVAHLSSKDFGFSCLIRKNRKPFSEFLPLGQVNFLAFSRKCQGLWVIFNLELPATNIIHTDKIINIYKIEISSIYKI